MSDRISWVDYAKGIGIILVVYGHVLRGINTAGMNLSENFFYISDKFIYGFHMPLFFFLSGLFIVKWAERNFKKSISQKAIILLIPYFIWSIVQGGINIILSTVTNKEYTVKQMVSDLFFSPIGQFWFVLVLFFISIIFYGLYRKLDLQKIFILSIPLFILSNLFHVWVFDELMFYFVFFVLGAMVNSNQIKLKDDIFVVLTVVMIFILTSASYIFTDTTYIINQCLIFLVATTGVLTVVYLSKILANVRFTNVFKYLGVNSMPIYLIHIICASGMRIILQKAFHYDGVLGHIIIGTLAGILFPLVAMKLFDKLNLNLILFGQRNIVHKNGSDIVKNKIA